MSEPTTMISTGELERLRNYVGKLEREHTGLTHQVKLLQDEVITLTRELSLIKGTSQTLIDSVRATASQYGLGDTESLQDFIARLHAANPQ